MDNELVRLAKLMELTTSDNDNEALSALRHANALRKTLGKTWAELLEPPIFPRVTVTVFKQEPSAPNAMAGDWIPPHLTDKETIGMMFREVFKMPNPGDGTGIWNFLESIKGKFDKYGRLTQAQYNGLRNTYTRVVKARR